MKAARYLQRLDGFKMEVPCRRPGCSGRAHLYDISRNQAPAQRHWRITCTGCKGRIMAYRTAQETFLRYYSHNEVDDLDTKEFPPVPVIVFGERKA